MAKAKRNITPENLPLRLRLVFDVRTDKHPDIAAFYMQNQDGYSSIIRDALSLYLLVKQRTENQSFSQMIGTVTSALSGIPVALEIPTARIAPQSNPSPSTANLPVHEFPQAESVVAKESGSVAILSDSAAAMLQKQADKF